MCWFGLASCSDSLFGQLIFRFVGWCNIVSSAFLRLSLVDFDLCLRGFVMWFGSRLYGCQILGFVIFAFGVVTSGFCVI